MFCDKCGQPLNDGDLFCGNCGAKVDIDKAEMPAESSRENEAEEPNNEGKADTQEESVPDSEAGFDPYSFSTNGTSAESSREITAEPQPDFAADNESAKQEKYQSASNTAAGDGKANGTGTKTIKINKKILIIVLVVIAVIVAASVGVSALKKQYLPEKTAQAFADSLFSQNWNEVYDSINIEESEFVNKEQFVAMCEEDPGCFGIDLASTSYYSVYCTSGGEAGMNRSLFSMSCVTSSGDGDIDFVVVKDKDRFWFFDTYKIEIANSPIMSYRIFAPARSKVQVNGIDIKFVDATEEEIAHYEIESILPGKYEVTVSRDNCEDYKGTMTVYNRYEYIEDEYSEFGYNNGSEIVNGGDKSNCYFVSLYYTDEYLKSIEDTATSLLLDMMKKAADCSNDISDFEFIDDESRQSAQETIDYIVENMSYDRDSEYYSYGDISFDSLEIDRDYDDFIYCFWTGYEAYSFDYDLVYSYSWSYNGDFFSDSGVYEHSDDPCITIENSDGEWKISYIDFYIYI